VTVSPAVMASVSGVADARSHSEGRPGVPATVAAGLLWLLLVSPLSAAAAEFGALTPTVLRVESDATVAFVNRSGRLVHINFLGQADEHHVFQIPGRIRATFHRVGSHPYVVHFESGPRTELRGLVVVQQSHAPRHEALLCRSVTVHEICLEP
jgi:hypothetical protein